MKVTFMGTGGSVPISNSRRSRFGGNTTCVRVESECLPQGMALVIDAGSGFVPLASTLIKEGITDLHILFTHYHHDHTQGLLLAGTTFAPSVNNNLWGWDERGIGPEEVFKMMMAPPFFPINFTSRRVASHFRFKIFKDPCSEVIVIHPQGGVKRIQASEFERLELAGEMVKFEGEKFNVRETLVVRMLKSNHPEYTLCYRFEERPTGKVFVFLTDHENTDGLPNDMRSHLKEADLLVMDCQYKREIYDTRTAGFGHGTADYCVRVAHQVNARKLGLTHHDPSSTDDDILAILKEAEDALAVILSGTAGATLAGDTQQFIVAICDYQSFEL